MTDAARAGSRGGGAAPAKGGRGASRKASADARTQTAEACAASTDRSEPPGRRLSEQTQTRIGAQLRSLYDNVLQQPVPDRFRDLIERLDAEKPETP